MHDLSRLSQALLDAAKQAGADAADVLTVQGTAVEIDVREGKLEQAERSEGIDLGLRVFIRQKQACISSSDSSDRAISEMAERAVAMAKVAPADPYAGLADRAQLATNTDVAHLELHDPSPEPSAKTLQDDAQAAEEAARAINGVAQVQSASASYSARDIHVANSLGFNAGYARTDRSISCVAISGTGLEMERDYDFDARIFQNELRSAADIGRVAGERCVERTGARQPATGTYPVLFDERISSSLISHLLSAVNGAGIARGSSWLRDALGQQVLPQHLSITENPHRARVSGSRVFDAEGLPTKQRAIVEAGTLTGWTLDLATARQLGLESTANAMRGTSSPPRPSTTNISLTQGTQSRGALIRDMGTGLLVTSMIGSTINPNTGDYSRGASGFWVENGEIAYPVNECTIAGNLKAMLGTIVPANDAHAHLNYVVPSLLVDRMTLAGA